MARTQSDEVRTLLSKKLPCPGGQDTNRLPGVVATWTAEGEYGLRREWHLDSAFALKRTGVGAFLTAAVRSDPVFQPVHRAAIA